MITNFGICEIFDVGKHQKLNKTLKILLAKEQVL